MKVRNLFENEEEILVEGVKFGRKEIELVKREARNLICGFEWEYHVDKDLLQQTDTDFDENDIALSADLLMHKDIQRQKTEWTDRYIADQMEAYNVEDGTINLNTIKKLAKDNMKYIDSIVKYEDEFEQIMGDYESAEDLDEDDKTAIREYLYSVYTLHQSFNFINKAIQSLEYENQLDSWIHLISGRNRSIAEDYNEVSENANSFFRWSTRLVEGLKSLNMRDGFGSYDKLVELYNISGKGFYVELYPTQQWIDYVDSMSGDDETWDWKIKSHYTLEAVSEWDDQVATDPQSILGYVPRGVPQQFWDQAISELSGEGGEITNNDYVDYITERLQDNRNPWGIDSDDIQRVMVEVGIEDGVETISKPLPLHDALELNEQMFDHIRDIGFTSAATGLHVNMSMKGMNFRRDNFNTAKLILLLNPKMLQQFFGLRGYVDDQFKGLTDHRLFDIAGGRNANDQLKRFETLAFKVDKHHQVNAGNFFDHTDAAAHQDRLEFRYVGGKDYEHRQKTIEWNIYRMAYMMLVAFNEGFGRKEYLKEVYRVLDVYTKKHFMDMQFQELVEWRKKNPKGSFDDINMDAMLSKRNTIDKRISGRK